MKKYINLALIYAVCALVAGVFYREFTKWNGFTGVTTLGKVHTHLFMLGMFLFLLVALFAQNHDLEGQKSFRLFMKVHNVGLPLVAITMIVRGVTQVLGTELSKGLNASIAGMPVIGPILVSIGIISLLLALKKVVKDYKQPLKAQLLKTFRSVFFFFFEKAYSPKWVGVGICERKIV